MQYAETLPLADHEVVLTFDDGPLPHNSNQVLEILASQCVKATFFEIGRMAQSSPEGIRKLRDAGHTIGTHTQNHPLSMDRMPIERARQEIDAGIASVKAALGDGADTSLAPFFRIPGLLRADGVEHYLVAQGIQIWSADFPADDWHHISASRVYDLAMRRLEAKGKGILLLHDIQARTVAALPRILSELKARGYRIVHVVPASAERPATPTEAGQWLLHPPAQNDMIARWPKLPNFVFADLGELPAPAPDIVADEARPVTLAELQFDHRQRPSAAWPRPPQPMPESAPTLPAPAKSLFEMPIGFGIASHDTAASARRAERTRSNPREAVAKLASAGSRVARRPARGRVGPGYGPAINAHGSSNMGARVTPSAATAHRGSDKRLVQVKKKRSA
jgi:peptidoglycan-N-acetylglucosamine deacetylase